MGKTSPLLGRGPDRQRGAEITDDPGQLSDDLRSDGSFLQGLWGGGVYGLHLCGSKNTAKQVGFGGDLGCK